MSSINELADSGALAGGNLKVFETAWRLPMMAVSLGLFLTDKIRERSGAGCRFCRR